MNINDVIWKPHIHNQTWTNTTWVLIFWLSKRHHAKFVLPHLKQQNRYMKKPIIILNLNKIVTKWTKFKQNNNIMMNINDIIWKPYIHDKHQPRSHE